jgi:Undecaprenyl-phosphate galactose phosphotransferase WbaP
MVNGPSPPPPAGAVSAAAAVRDRRAGATAPVVVAAEWKLARAARVALLAFTDFAALASAGAIAYVVWARPVHQQSAGQYFDLLPVVGLFLLGYAQAGLYPGFGLGPVETLRRVTYVTAIGFLVVATLSFALKVPHLYSRFTFVIAFALSLGLVPIGRAIVTRLVHRVRWWSEPVIVVGTGARSAKAIRNLRSARHLGYRPAGVIAPAPTAATEVEGTRVLGDLDRAPILARQGFRVALLETDQIQDRAILDRLHQHFRHVVLLREYDDLPVEGLQVRNLGGLVGIEYTNNLLRHSNQVVKRALDLAIGGAALVAAAPVIAVAILLVKLIDRGPAFFKQSRAGLNGRRFTVPKIRTMKADAEAALAEHLAANSELRDEWDANYKLKDDPRLISGIGRLFRQFSVDELPQLWSVLKGEMSLIGPRPFPDYHLARFTPAFLELRQRVRPGITGLWQITVRSDGGIEDQEALDSYYIRNWSVWLDLYILCRTLAAVASGRGAY